MNRDDDNDNPNVEGIRKFKEFLFEQGRIRERAEHLIDRFEKKEKLTSKEKDELIHIALHDCSVVKLIMMERSGFNIMSFLASPGTWEKQDHP